MGSSQKGDRFKASEEGGDDSTRREGEESEREEGESEGEDWEGEREGEGETSEEEEASSQPGPSLAQPIPARGDPRTIPSSSHAQPLLLAGRRVALSVAGGKLGRRKAIKCEAEGSHWWFRMGEHEVALSVKRAPAVPSLSRLLIVHARYRLLNRTGRNVWFEASQGGPQGVLPADQSLPRPVQWSGRSKERRWMRITLTQRELCRRERHPL